MSIIGMTKKQLRTAHVGVPILVRFWEEDGVWNASAFDIGVAVFGETFEAARDNFSQALESHFELLSEMGRATETVARLSRLAQSRGFYQERMKSREPVERFEIPYELEACHA